MKRLLYTLSSLIILISLFSCGNTSSVGTSLLTDEVQIIMDSSFTVTGSSTPNAEVQSRTTTQLLGLIDAKEYGNFSSEFVTQFMPAAQIDTTGIPVDNIDSLKLIMAVPNGAVVGDSVVPMGLEVYLLDKELPNPIYSDFDAEGYYDPSQPIASTIYNVSAIGESDSVSALSYRYIYVTLPRTLGRELYQAYLENPSSYLTPKAFVNIFKGLYVRNSFGSGRVARINSSLMRLYWHTDTVSSQGTDSIIPGYGNYYAVTPEIITNNIIDFEMAPSLQSMIDQGRTIIAAPTGSDAIINFPAQDIIDVYRSGSGPIAMVNDLTMSVPAKLIANEYGINPPPYLLLVLKSEKTAFFMNNNLPDNETSFFAAYNEETGSYDFTGMRDYALWLLAKNNITADDYTFILTPVTLNYGTNNSGYYGSSSYLESVAPYVLEPAMTELDLEKVKIIFTYSKQSKK